LKKNRLFHPKRPVMHPSVYLLSDLAEKPPDHALRLRNRTGTARNVQSRDVARHGMV